MKNSTRSELAYMYTEATHQLSGYEDQTYIDTFNSTTGDEPPSLLITHSSTYPYWVGNMPYTPASSSTPCQWRALSEALRLATVSPDLRRILVFPPKGKPYTVQTVWPSWTRSWNLNLQSIANTTYIFASEFSSALFKGTQRRNSGS